MKRNEGSGLGCSKNKSFGSTWEQDVNLLLMCGMTGMEVQCYGSQGRSPCSNFTIYDFTIEIKTKCNFLVLN